MELTQQQNNRLAELKITGLARKIAYEKAKEDMATAYKIEQKAEQQALIEYNRQNKTNYEESYLIEDSQEYYKYLHILQNEFSKLGIKNELNKVYTYQFSKKFVRAEKTFLMVAVEFLTIMNQNKIAKELQNHINTYIKQDYKDQIFELNNKLIMGE